MEWTSEQKKVIEIRNSNMLVSAAAGSGKTAVLVERIIQRILDAEHPVDIDKLLIVTFTNAAASEMRERIRNALEKKAMEEPENPHLQRQMVLVHNAKITTIHSFCLQVLRNHFQAAGVDPGFRIADEGESMLLKQDAVKEILDEAYEEAAQEKKNFFYNFLECFATGKDDKAIETTVLQIYEYAQGEPWPEKWLDACEAMYQENAAFEWLKPLVDETGFILDYLELYAKKTLDLVYEPDGPYIYEEAILADIERIRTLKSAAEEAKKEEKGIEAIYNAYSTGFYFMEEPVKLSSKRDSSISKEKRDQAKDRRSEFQKRLQILRDNYYFDRPEIVKEEFLASGDTVRVLIMLTRRLIQRLQEKKQERGVLDFSDMEHYALRALLEEKDGEYVPTAVAQEYALSFEEVMIDEYQDSNLVQELLLKSVSGKGKGVKNRFMVGDVKQSIYRFRLARPELFMEKFERYQRHPEDGVRIDLHQNFRSRTQVLEAANFVFSRIMTKQLGEIEYDENAALYPGAVFEACEKITSEELQTQLILADNAEENKQEVEANLVAHKIQTIVGKEYVWDKEEGCYRPAQYRDIVILLRTVSGWAETFVEILGERGIPCYTGTQSGYFSALEIRVMLAYLQILDNPRQDIPLTAVLHSPIGAMEEETLAKIRCAYPEGLFYDGCRNYLQEGTDEAVKEKLQSFFYIYDALRKKICYTPVHMLIWEILEKTGYGECVLAMPAGRQRKANLDMLVEKAIAYEATSYRGLYHFVRYIENLKKYEVDYGEANITAENADTVKIMSIHKSKGLEFPIVFVSGTGKQFNESDSKNKVLTDPTLGIACDYMDKELRAREATLLKRAIRSKSKIENLGEELRVLYVAMTRAKERMIITGTHKNLEKSMQAWQQKAEGQKDQLSYVTLSEARCYLDWIMPAFYMQEDGPIRLQIAGQNEQEEELQENSEEAIRLAQLLHLDRSVCFDAETKDYLSKVFAQSYAHEMDQKIIQKLSVSELKKRSHVPEENEGAELIEQEVVIPLLPSFEKEEEVLKGAARGTAYHLFMENLDYSRWKELEIQLEELVTCGKMSQEEREVINISDIERFLETESGQRMKNAALTGNLFREHPFVFAVDADQIDPAWNSQEKVLVQGIIDAFFYEGDEIVLLDYKTDHVFLPNQLILRYHAQLEYYAQALSSLTGCKVKDKIIYSFHLGEDILL